ncbi:hypothetical protein CLOM_g4716 [Closterium sp. NIES-68]|nr:hypothetical protein CLOM_g4713 [Closterium sp. NIES-68]GJP45312.1 hypothetical protein CLOM_g4716 [Closterium sp. NIES-68]GJP57990.1 hypothetical protein CLOP_g19906 [Closterium sp. NIES-67]GJP57993.1 hypothetical protein CLOP_g19909 [Closterium sp. NIES-67]
MSDLLFERQQHHLFTSPYTTHQHHDHQSQASPWNFATSPSSHFGDPFGFDGAFDSPAGYHLAQKRRDHHEELRQQQLARQQEIARQQQLKVAQELSARKQAAKARRAQHVETQTKARPTQQQQDELAIRQIPVQRPASSKSPETQAASPRAAVAGIPVTKIASKSLLTADDAARKLQAAWRGYSVRQGKPLELARSIADVRKLAREMGAQLRDSELIAKMVSEPLEKLRVNETIMSWLLRLDEVQSRNQDIRNLRRDMARKLTKLLDRVDTLSTSRPPSVGNIRTAAVAETGTQTEAGSDTEYEDAPMEEEAENPLETAAGSGVSAMDDSRMDVDGGCSSEDGCHSSQCSEDGDISSGNAGVATSTQEGGRVAKRMKQRQWRDALWQWKERMAGRRGGLRSV